MTEIIVNNQEPLIENKRTFIKNKHKIYINEREIILKKIYNIIGIKDDCKRFYSHELDKDQNKINQILELTDDIIKYFSVSDWTAFKLNREISRRHLSIVKSVMKDMNVNFEHYSLKVKNEQGRFINTTVHILK